MNLSLRDVCSLIAPFVNNELYKEYIPLWYKLTVSNPLGLQRILHNALANLNAPIKDDEADHMAHFLKLCGLLYCDSSTPLDLKHLILCRLIPQFLRCTVNVYSGFLIEMWRFCIRLSLSESRQQQSTAYFLFEQIVHLYAPPTDSSDHGVVDVVYFEIRKTTNLDDFLLRGLTFPSLGDSLGFNVSQAALNIIKRIINFKQPSSSSISNKIGWNGRDATKWSVTLKSYIGVYELIGKVKDLSVDQYYSITAILNPNNNSRYLGKQWVMCLTQRGLGNINANARTILLRAILESTNENTVRNSKMHPNEKIDLVRSIEFILFVLLSARIPPDPLVFASLKSDVDGFLKRGGNLNSRCILQLRDTIESACIRDQKFHQVTCVAHVVVAVELAFTQNSYQSFVRSITEEHRESLMRQIVKAMNVFKGPSKQVWAGTTEDYDALLCAFDLLKVSNSQLLLKRIREGCLKWIEAAPLLNLDNGVKNFFQKLFEITQQENRSLSDYGFYSLLVA